MQESDIGRRAVQRGEDAGDRRPVRPRRVLSHTRRAHRGEITALRDRTDELMDDPEIQTRFDPNLGDSRYIEVRAHATTGEELPFILRNCIELDQMYRDMLVREPIFSLAEAIVGKNSKFCGENVIRNVPGLAIEFWHSDGDVWFPLPDSIARHDPKARMPALWFTVQVALTDIETVEQGPTQYVPASHYSGRPVSPSGGSQAQQGRFGLRRGRGAGVRRERTRLNAVQGGRHIPATPDDVASGCAQHLGPHALSLPGAVRGQLGVRTLQPLQPGPRARRCSTNVQRQAVESVGPPATRLD